MICLTGQKTFLAYYLKRGEARWAVIQRESILKITLKKFLEEIILVRKFYKHGRSLIF